MKFAKELEQELVPEWRAKYLDYKAGKKKLKAISRALQKTNRSPSHASLRHNYDDQPSALPAGPDRDSSTRQSNRKFEATDPVYNPTSPARSGALTSRSTPGRRSERQPLRVPSSRFSTTVGSYGSIIATPPQHAGSSDVASFELPDPAIDPKVHDFDPNSQISRQNVPRTPSPVISRNDSIRTVSDMPRRTPSTKTDKGLKSNTLPGSGNRRASQLIKRVFSYTDPLEKQEGQQLSEFDRRQDEFIEFLDTEFDKIETFYQMKEEEATERLKVLRQQLHIMRDQRIHEVLSNKEKARTQAGNSRKQNGFAGLNGSRLKEAFMGHRIGKNSKALAGLATPAADQGQRSETITRRRDFSRRPEDTPNNEVSYRSAKRKLKHALQEFYRGVELLKAYAYLNRTAFRKINKKYDKVVNARPPLRYMSDKVNKAWFVQSEVTENLMAAAEDLYARYFERGNRKIAISKLRKTLKRSGDYSPNTFRAGLLLMAGILFAIQGLIYAGQHFDHSDPIIPIHTSYLLQVGSEPIPHVPSG
ncbi:SPX domain-containing protein [Aspergillus avenaceus]|uniref:SPX domain-containing protein n=1 Tax=Aspergillus avenaceus TaxID=36643 RepID=A0A5N6TXJ3_ASPAV|nr:SPX domain-containing protein [Aspergillus avenaceus]